MLYATLLIEQAMISIDDVQLLCCRMFPIAFET